MVDVADGDGNDLGSGYEIEQIEAFASIDQQPWDVDADSAGFYGYAKDGVCRYNGQTTQPGVFASGAGAFNRRSWGDGQGLLAFGNIDGDAAAIGADTIRLSNTFDAWAADFIDSAARWYFNGDFDITLDFANFSSSGGTDGGFSLEAWADEGNGLYLRRNGPLGRYDRDVMSGGSWLSGANAATSDTSGTLRISRSGATVRTFYWTGSWTELGTGYAMARTDPMWIKIKLSGTGTVTLSADASNFQILSGTWTNKASWAEECFSTTRGNAVAFPNSLLVLASWGGVDLIDTDNDLLWMHFDVGTGDMLHNDVYKARDAAFEDGILLLAGSAEANNEGSLTVIDFNLDAARIPRYEESSITGGYFDAVSGQSSDSGRARTIANRNGGAGYSQDFNRWSVGSGATKNPHNAVALALASGKVYAVGGGNESLTVFRWDRWDVLNTWRDNVDAAYWNVSGEQVYWTWFRPQDNTLFWTADDAGDTVLYSQALASIELPMHGGNFSASTSKVLPGDRLLAAVMLSHHRPVINGATVYAVALDEVWTMTWPGGSWSRWLGLPGSGATYETLPTNLFRLTAIRHVKDATLDLLAVSLDTGIRSQVLLYRMDTGALHAKTRLDGARVLTSLAAAI